MKVYLPQGDHVFSRQFMDDKFANDFTQKDAYDRKKNKYIDSITFVGPYKSNIVPPSRKKILICDPKAGAAA